MPAFGRLPVRYPATLITTVSRGEDEIAMKHEVSMNKQGQVLGRKGLETRTRLMMATRQLLYTHPLVDITAVAIAKAAGTSSASFYMYFDDVQDVLYALGLVTREDMAKAARLLGEPWDPDDYEKHALQLIEALNGVWNRHREVLRYRNLEADRGDPRFEELRMTTYVPYIERFAQLILGVNPAVGGRRRSDAYAEATVLHAAMERLAAVDPLVIERGLGAKRINAAMARVIAQTLRGGAGAAVGAGSAARKTARVRAAALAAKPAKSAAVKPARRASAKAG